MTEIKNNILETDDSDLISNLSYIEGISFHSTNRGTIKVKGLSNGLLRIINIIYGQNKKSCTENYLLCDCCPNVLKCRLCECQVSNKFLLLLHDAIEFHTNKEG